MIKRNMERDLEVTRKLEEEGWIVLRFWSKQIIKDLDGCVNKIIEVLNTKS